MVGDGAHAGLQRRHGRRASGVGDDGGAVLAAARRAVGSPAAPAIALAALVGIVMAFGLSFEIDRLVEAAAPGAIAWPAAQFKQMSWTVLWTISAGAFLA